MTAVADRYPALLAHARPVSRHPGPPSSVLDIIPGVGKTIAFGYIIGIIGTYEGFNSSRGTEGVGRAATNAVVLASLNIIFLDMVLVKLFLVFFGSE